MFLTGYTSTTLDQERATRFAFNGDPSNYAEEPEKSALLLEIEFTGSQQFIYLNSDNLSAYPMEEEVLLQDGVQYKVLTVDKETRTVEWRRTDRTEYQKNKIYVVKLKNIPEKY